MIYKEGDKVWVRNDFNIKDEVDGGYYFVSVGEIDVRGRLVTILSINISDLYIKYDVENYNNLHHWCIDHEKTARGAYQEPQYEIY